FNGPGETTSQFLGVNVGGQGDTHFSIVADPTSPNIVFVGGDTQPGDGPRPNAASTLDGVSLPNATGATNFTGRIFRGDFFIPRGPTGNGSGAQWSWVTGTKSSNATVIANNKANSTSGAGGTAPHAAPR